MKKMIKMKNDFIDFLAITLPMVLTFMVVGGVVAYQYFPKTETSTKFIYPEVRESSFHAILVGEITIPLTEWGQPNTIGVCSVTANRIEVEAKFETIVPPNAGIAYTMNSTNTYVSFIHFVFDGNVTVRFVEGLCIRVDHFELTINTFMTIDEFLRNIYMV